MRKIFLMILVMFLCITVKAEEQIEVKLEWVSNVYYNYEKDGLNYWGQFAYIYAGDKIAYCLDISTEVISDIYTKTNEIQTNNLVIKAGYFGYGYNNNVSLKDYMATQKLIWSFLGTDVYFTTESNGKGDKIDIWDNESRIRYMINNHATFPKYDSNFKFIVGNTYNLIQVNDINNGYTIVNDTLNNIEFDETGILFQTKEKGENNFYLETQYISRNDNTIYVADNSQKIMAIGSINNLKKKYEYEVIGGMIELQVKFDKIILNSSILDNTFELYDDSDTLLGTYIPNVDGYIKIDNLKLGDYKIKQVKISDGYEVLNKEYTFKITEQFLEHKKEIILSLKTINITINKYIVNPLTNNVISDDKIVYKIYNLDNNFIKEVVTDENGKTLFELDYGNYKIVQSNVNNIDKYHEDILIDESMFYEDKDYDIIDEIYQAKIKVIAIDKENNIPISNLKFSINIEEYTTNEDGYYITNTLDFGTYKFSNIMVEGYENLTDFDFELNNDCNFYIIDDEAYVDLVLNLEKVVEIIEEPITIEEETNIDYTLDKNETIEAKEEDNIDNIEDKEKEDEIIKNSSNDEKKDSGEEELSNEKTSIKEDTTNEDEKLPFLGESKGFKYVKKIYNFIRYLFNYIWLLQIR